MEHDRVQRDPGGAELVVGRYTVEAVQPQVWLSRVKYRVRVAFS